MINCKCTACEMLRTRGARRTPMKIQLIAMKHQFSDEVKKESNHG